MATDDKLYVMPLNEVPVPSQDKGQALEFVNKAWDDGLRILYATPRGLRLWRNIPNKGIIYAEWVHFPDTWREMSELVEAWWIDDEEIKSRLR